MTQPNDAPQMPDDGSKHLGQPVWRSKESPKWPLWAVLGILLIAVVYFFAGGTKPSPTPKPAGAGSGDIPVTVPQLGAPIDPLTLMTSATYRLSAETPLCEAAGKADAVVTKLVAGSQFGIIESQTVEGAKWYHVQATDSNGKEIGRGWISAESLKEQTLKLLQ